MDPSISGNAKANRLQAGRPVEANSSADRREKVNAAAGTNNRTARSTETILSAAAEVPRDVGLPMLMSRFL
jgi:hypothetical protein